MKLIIDIPEEMHEQIKDGYVPLGISKYLKNGTPLDNVKAEITEHHDIHLGKLNSRSNVGILMFGSDAYDRGIKHAIEILDRIGKESEEV